MIIDGRPSNQNGDGVMVQSTQPPHSACENVRWPLIGLVKIAIRSAIDTVLWQ